MLTKAPKGTKDIFGKDSYIWQHIEGTIRLICEAYGFSEIRTPIFEHTELFLRSVGETTDIVQKEMYTFTDKGSRSLSLRPEGTACVARAFIENSLYANPQPTKLYYLGPNFRYENPQDGRQRQFHQFGAELFGASSPLADAEAIALAKELLDRLGVPDTRILINSLGTPETRSVYIKKLTEYIKSKQGAMCKTCEQRLKINPLRTLDCKESGCIDAMKDAPECIDYLDEESGAHFKELQKILTELGIPFEVDPRIVRGLDYYTKTVFEIVSDNASAQKTICGGGRYDNMIKEFGGPDTPAFGFGLGIERLIMALKASGAAESLKVPSPEYFIGSIGVDGVRAAMRLVYALRKKGVSAEGDLLNRSVKAQFKYANKIGAKKVVIIGEEEISSETVVIRDMATGAETKMSMDKLLTQKITEGRI